MRHVGGYPDPLFGIGGSVRRPREAMPSASARVLVQSSRMSAGSARSDTSPAVPPG